MEFTDIFNDDAFSLIALTAAINEIDSVPGRAGELVFQGVGEGVATTTVSIERKGSSLTLIQTSLRGAPAPKESSDKATLRSVNIPHLALEDTITSDSVQGVRAFGTTDQLASVQSVVNGRLTKMASRHDLTLEHLRLGALSGQILDADGTTVLLDLFTLFGGSQHVVNFNLDMDELDSDFVDLRVQAMAVSRYIKRNAKTVIPSTAKVWAFCGDAFFDALISRDDVKATFLNTDEQRVRVGGNYAFGVFEYGGIVWENYQGTDDGSTVAIPTDECRLFLTGVPGLYAEYFAPGDFMETANTIGLPRYAKQAVDPRFNRYVELHTQQNPLPICLRPQTLIRGTLNAA